LTVGVSVGRDVDSDAGIVVGDIVSDGDTGGQEVITGAKLSPAVVGNGVTSKLGSGKNTGVGSKVGSCVGGAGVKTFVGRFVGELVGGIGVDEGRGGRGFLV
jgi:hypothetical protein